MTVSHGALERSLSALALGAVRRSRERERASRYQRLTERNYQIQVPITGTAYQGVVWIKKRVHFDVLFFGATGARDVEFEHPQVSTGYVIDPDDSKAPVSSIIPTCHVEWLQDDQEATYGCILHIGVHSPSVEPADFSGILHITFQGWGAPREGQYDGDEG